MSNENNKIKNNDLLFIAKVIIENFPSRVELYGLLDKYITDNKFVKDYTSDNLDNKVVFVFKNSVFNFLNLKDLAFGFVKYINLEKLRNSLYIKVRTNISVDTRKDISKKMFNDGKAKNKEKSIDNLPNKNILASSTVTDIPISKMNKKSDNIFKTENNLTMINDYSPILPRGKTLRTLIPYDNKSKRIHEEYLKNKEKWLVKKGFEVNFGKIDIEKKSVIPNYVFRSPPKIPILKYQFRDVNKDKWINKNSFVYKNSHDLVI